MNRLRQIVHVGLLLGGVLPLVSRGAPSDSIPRPPWWDTTPTPTIVQAGDWFATVEASLTNPSVPLTGFRVAGPFDNRDGSGFDRVYGPEHDASAEKEYAGARGSTVRWQPAPAEWAKTGSYRDLLPLFPVRYHVTAYVLCRFQLDQPATLWATAGSDDTLTVWHNGTQLLASNTYRGAAPDQEGFAIHGVAGQNALLLKIGQGVGDWGFYLDVKRHDPTAMARRRVKLLAAMMDARPAASGLHWLAAQQAADLLAELGDGERADALRRALPKPPADPLVRPTWWDDIGPPPVQQRPTYRETVAASMAVAAVPVRWRGMVGPFDSSLAPGSPQEARRRGVRLMVDLLAEFPDDLAAKMALPEIADELVAMGEVEAAKAMLYRRLLSVSGKGQPITVAVDCSGAPETAFWGLKAQALTHLVYPEIGRLIFPPGTEIPHSVRLRFRDVPGVAATSGDTVTISSGWIRSRPRDYGMVVHELVHVVQSYPMQSWLVEGIADYVRYACFERDRWRPPLPAGQDYRKGYGIAAGFLLWLRQTYDADIVVKLSLALRQKRYRAELFQEYTGHSLDALWQAYVAARRNAS